MLFTCKEDFYKKAAACIKLSREEEKECAALMKHGDETAKNKIICSYLPTVAYYVKKMTEEDRTLELIYRLVSALEKTAESFDFLQESETFSHRLSLSLRQDITRYIAEK